MVWTGVREIYQRFHHIKHTHAHTHAYEVIYRGNNRGEIHNIDDCLYVVSLRCCCCYIEEYSVGGYGNVMFGLVVVNVFVVLFS